MNSRVVIIVLVMQLFSGCFQISEDDLYEDYVPRIVIEGVITNTDSVYTVIITKTVPTDAESDFSPVTGAGVIVSDNSGRSEMLEMVSPGVYEGRGLSKLPETEYEMTALVGSASFFGEGIMPDTPDVVMVKQQYLYYNVPQPGYYLRFVIANTDTLSAYYKVDVRRNDSLYSSYSDLLIFGGEYVPDTVSYLVPYAFAIDDTVEININKISREVYDYFFELKKQTTNNFTPVQPPMLNPPSNISGDALGYFMVSSVFNIQVVIEDNTEVDEDIVLKY